MRNRGRKAPNPLTKTFESNGPDVKVRGTAQHIAEKYTQLSRDAQASGDRVAAENYLQHAEHYIRIILSAQAQFQQNFGFPRQFGDDQDDLGDDSGGYGIQDYSAPQPQARFPHLDEDGQPILPARGQQEQRNGERFERADRQERSERQDRPDRQERPDRQDRPERQERQERPDRQERRERFSRRREAAASRYSQTAPEDDAGLGQQPVLPAFLTTPVRPVIDDEQPSFLVNDHADADDEGLADSVAEYTLEEQETPEVEKTVTRTRRRRTTVAAEEGAAPDDAGDAAEAPARKPRATRTRRKSVDDVSVAD